MPTRMVHMVFDAVEPVRLARFWAAALGWEMEWEMTAGGSEVANVLPAGYSYPDPAAQSLVLLPVTEPKQAKNRVHLILATQSAAHQAAEVDRLLGLGAVPADAGQGDVPWRVLADPEGNVFCVLDPHTGPVAATVADCTDLDVMAGFWELAAGWTRRGAANGRVMLRSPRDIGRGLGSDGRSRGPRVLCPHPRGFAPNRRSGSSHELSAGWFPDTDRDEGTRSGHGFEGQEVSHAEQLQHLALRRPDAAPGLVVIDPR